MNILPPPHRVLGIKPAWYRQFLISTALVFTLSLAAGSISPAVGL